MTLNHYPVVAANPLPRTKTPRQFPNRLLARPCSNTGTHAQPPCTQNAPEPIGAFSRCSPQPSVASPGYRRPPENRHRRHSAFYGAHSIPYARGVSSGWIYKNRITFGWTIQDIVFWLKRKRIGYQNGDVSRTWANRNKKKKSVAFGRLLFRHWKQRFRSWLNVILNTPMVTFLYERLLWKYNFFLKIPSTSAQHFSKLLQ